MKNGSEEYSASECFLEVRVGNDPAINLYERLGFTKVKRNFSYYLDGEDAWVMAISLEEKQG
jgi:ribosomal-protein-alanine N-acetyltransferase